MVWLLTVPPAVYPRLLTTPKTETLVSGPDEACDVFHLFTTQNFMVVVKEDLRTRRRVSRGRACQVGYTQLGSCDYPAHVYGRWCFIVAC